jgi:hypothetical protein
MFRGNKDPPSNQRGDERSKGPMNRTNGSMENHEFEILRFIGPACSPSAGTGPANVVRTVRRSLEWPPEDSSMKGGERP